MRRALVAAVVMASVLASAAFGGEPAGAAATTTTAPRSWRLLAQGPFAFGVPNVLLAGASHTRELWSALGYTKTPPRVQPGELAVALSLAPRGCATASLAALRIGAGVVEPIVTWVSGRSRCSPLDAFTFVVAVRGARLSGVTSFRTCSEPSCPEVLSYPGDTTLRLGRPRGEDLPFRQVAAVSKSFAEPTLRRAVGLFADETAVAAARAALGDPLQVDLTADVLVGVQLPGSSSCPERVVAVRRSRSPDQLHVVTEIGSGASPDGANVCTADLGPRTVVIAVPRASLPALPVGVLVESGLRTATDGPYVIGAAA